MTEWINQEERLIGCVECNRTRAFMNNLQLTVNEIVQERNDLRTVLTVARLVADSPPRSAQLVRLLSSLKEKIEELDSI